jgi:hypothetical protein
MAISSQKRKATKLKSSQAVKQPSDEASSSTTTAATEKKAKTSGQPAVSIQPSQTNKVYQRFKKLVEKASLQKRHAQANTIQARNDLKSKKKAAAAAVNFEENNADEVATSGEKSYFDLNFSRQNLIEKRDFFDKSLRDLKEKLKFVKEIGADSSAPHTHASTQDKEFEREYIGQLSALDEDANESLSHIKTWHDKQQKEIERQFKSDNKQCVREFQKKRGDLKKKLMHKYDDMKRQVEVENTLLDINMDKYEMIMIKLPRTRNLRKRINTNVPMYNFDYSIDWLNLGASKKSHASIDILARCATGEHRSLVEDGGGKYDNHDTEFNKANFSSSEADLNNNVMIESAAIAADPVVSSFE